MDGESAVDNPTSRTSHSSLGSRLSSHTANADRRGRHTTREPSPTYGETECSRVIPPACYDTLWATIPITCRGRFATCGQTDRRGLVTAGRLFGRNGAAALGLGVASVLPLEPIAAHSCFRRSFLALPPHRNGVTDRNLGGGRDQGCSSTTANEQRHPASPRAMVTLAITGRFLRSVNCSHR